MIRGCQHELQSPCNDLDISALESCNPSDLPDARTVLTCMTVSGADQADLSMMIMTGVPEEAYNSGPLALILLHSAASPASVLSELAQAILLQYQ